MLNIAALQKAYFTYDRPCPYRIGDTLLVATPIMLENAEIFLASIDILQHDKNAASSVEIIQMSYLQYLAEIVIQSDPYVADKLTNILHICWGMDDWEIRKNGHGKFVLDDRTHGIEISAKKFDEMGRIILYQNILHYDDEYVNPEFKKTMAEVDAVKNFNKELPTLERKMSIITAHTGIIKKQQLAMTFREHQALFEEVSGEVDFITTRALAMYCGDKNYDHWIYRNKKNKYDGYMLSMGKYKQSFGGDSSISVATGDGTSHAEQLLSQNNL